MAQATLERYAPDSRIGDVSAKELRGIVAAIARGAGLDAVRAQVVARAETLNIGGVLPDNWGPDGKLKRAVATWQTEEQRETWSDLRTGLQAALTEKYETSDDWCYWIWLQDFTDAEVIFCKGETLYSAPYTVTDGGPIEIGDASTVRPITEYVKTEPEPRQRTGRRILKPDTVEWRRAKVGMMSKAPREYRHFATSPEITEVEDSWLFRGFASVYDVWYDMGWYEELVALGAGRRTLAENPDVQFLLNHGGLPLARTVPGTLRLDERTIEDRTGLFSEADLDPADPDAQTLKRKNARGDLDEMSFAFAPTSDKWNADFTQRIITTYSLHKGDVSVVNYGANPATSGASIRALNGVIGFLEQRAGAGQALSAPAIEILTRVLSLVADDDGAVSDAQPLLAELMEGASPDEPPVERAIEIPDHLTRARQELAVLTAGRRS